MNPDDPLGLIGTPPKQAASDPLGLMTPAPAPVVDATPEEPTYATQALGGLASLARDIPGAEALQAMAGMRGLDLTKASDRSQFGDAYKESLGNLRSAEDAAPTWVRRGNRVIGGLLAGAAIPGSSAALQGARYGVAEGLLGADPSTVEDRLHEAAWKAPVDAALGHAFGEVVPQVVRSYASKAVDEASLLRKEAMSKFDSLLYGKADQEAALAAANPMPQALSDAFSDPTIKPYIDAVRTSPVWEGASPGKIAHEAYKLMSERQGKLGNIVANSGDYKAGTDLEYKEISQAKQKLLDAASEVMPSFRPAVAGHAKLAGERDAFEAARDATGNIVRGKSGATKNLETKSPAAFMQSIFDMTPGEAKAGTQGLLGELKETPSALTYNPFKMFGGPKAMARAARIAPYLNALDRRAGNKLPSLLRAAAVSSGGLLDY